VTSVKSDKAFVSALQQLLGRQGYSLVSEKVR
jgi:hypothetical protein